MPRLTYKTCKNCEGHSRDVGPISWERLCATCGKQRYFDNLDQLQAGTGPFAEHWENRLVMSIIRRQTKRIRRATENG